MTSGAILASLSPVRAVEPSCIVEPDESSVVRHAKPLDARAVEKMREQARSRMRRDPAAIVARERLIAIHTGGGAAVPREDSGPRQEIQ